MSGICSAHQHYEKGCRLCEAGREKFITGEEVPEGYREKVTAMIKEVCEIEEKYGIDELDGGGT
jgi:hypothetical protein